MCTRQWDVLLYSHKIEKVCTHTVTHDIFKAFFLFDWIGYNRVMCIVPLNTTIKCNYVHWNDYYSTKQVHGVPLPVFHFVGIYSVSRKDTSTALFSCLQCACTAIDDFVPKGVYAGGYALQLKIKECWKPFFFEIVFNMCMDEWIFSTHNLG